MKSTNFRLTYTAITAYSRDVAQQDVPLWRELPIRN